MKNKSLLYFNIQRSSCLLAVIALCACGGPKLKEGNVEDLLSGKTQADDGAVRNHALEVEQVATALPPQVDEYLIGPNDVLNITVLGHEEFSSARDFNKGIVGTVVKKDGAIYVPILGAVLAEGKSVQQFQIELTARIAEFVKDPQLSVDVLKYESQKFYVLGEVNKPGAFPVDGAITLLEAIGKSEGITENGNLERAYVIRDQTLLPINLADVLLKGDTSRNIYMKDRDLVYVPNASDQTVYVLGEVNEPGAVQIKSNTLTIGQAISEAGGIKRPDARKRSIKLIRGGWSEPTVYKMDWDTITAYGDSIMLEPGDRIVVDPTTLTVMSRYMVQILPFLMGADAATAIHTRYRN